MSKKKILFEYNDGGLNSYEYVMINGIKQYVQIRGKKKDNPVLLFVHGGPGGALSGLSHVMQKEWEQYFTVVNFDQRNAGKTYCANKDKAMVIGKTGTLEDYIKDIHDVIKYAHTKCEFEKLYLVGFSWGSVISAEYAKRYPENIVKYIGVGQLINYEEGFKLICDKAALKAEEANKTMNAELLRGLSEDFASGDSMTPERMKAVRTFAMLANKYLVKHAKPFPMGAIIKSPFMKFKEKKAMFNSDVRLFEKTYETMFNYDFLAMPKFEIPVCFVYGNEDISCPSELFEQNMDLIDAPKKEMHIIEDASHMCFYDQPEKFLELLKDLK